MRKEQKNNYFVQALMRGSSSYVYIIALKKIVVNRLMLFFNKFRLNFGSCEKNGDNFLGISLWISITYPQFSQYKSKLFRIFVQGMLSRAVLYRYLSLS